MRKRQIAHWTMVGFLIAAFGMTTACWKTDESEPEAVVEQSEPAIDLGREDMAALPSAEVDLKLLEDFPYYLRQESSQSAEAIYAYYDEFFSNKGWSVDINTDPLIGMVTHSYQLGDELAFVTVQEIGPGNNEVVLARRNVNDPGELDDDD